MSKKTIGIWLDIGENNTRKYLKNHVKMLNECGVDEVYLMINSVDHTDIEWSVDGIKEVADEFKKNGIVTGITLWFYPKKKNMKKIVKCIKEINEKTGIFNFEFDTEKNFSSKYNEFNTLEEAAEHFHRMLPNKDNIRYLGTSFLARINEDVADFIDSYVIQSYSISFPKGHEKHKLYNNPDGDLYPGTFQKICFNAAFETFPDEDIYMGLAGYSQTNYEGLKASESMKIQYEEANKHVDKIMYWSYKFLGGKDGKGKNKYFYRFLKGLKKSKETT